MPGNSDLAIFREIALKRPAVHCLTNTVVQALTANMLLAVGAIPSMSADPAEVESFTEGASALLVNLGTLDPIRMEAIGIAIRTARARRIPWILDPVLVDRAPKRLAYARELLVLQPALIRGNAAEIAALAGAPDALAREARTIVAVTGATDLVTDGGAPVSLTGGHELMSRVTGIGCAGTALLAAALGVSKPADWRSATVTVLRLFGEAGGQTAAASAGPGSFAARLLDELYQFSQTSLHERNDK